MQQSGLVGLCGECWGHFGIPVGQSFKNGVQRRAEGLQVAMAQSARTFAHQRVQPMRKLGHTAQLHHAGGAYRHVIERAGGDAAAVAGLGTLQCDR